MLHQRQISITDENRRTLGFTLVELLIVIIVIAIIAGFAVNTVGKIVTKAKVASVEHHLEIISDAANLYTIDVGERPRGDMSGSGTCDSWNEDSRDVFYSGVRNTNPIPEWNGPYVTSWPEETPLGGCYVYRAYLAGSNTWARSNWFTYADDTKLADLTLATDDIEIIMVRFYPLNDHEAIELSRELARLLMKIIPDDQILYVKNQAVIGYYILPRDEEF